MVALVVGGGPVGVIVVEGGETEVIELDVDSLVGIEVCVVAIRVEFSLVADNVEVETFHILDDNGLVNIIVEVELVLLDKLLEVGVVVDWIPLLLQVTGMPVVSASIPARIDCCWMSSDKGPES